MKKWLILILIFSTQTWAKFDLEHQKFTQLLQKYTKLSGSQTLVNYKRLKKNHHELKEYLSSLESLSRKEFDTFSKEDKLAFWINAYNANTLEIIVRNYPVKSIKDISGLLPGVFGTSVWKKEFITLFNKKMHLDNIEHDIIRPKFHEPRIHFAVNCASISCPSLMQVAFTGEKLGDQLDQAADTFLKDKQKNYLKNNTLYLSKIFDWYGDDFKGKYKSYLNYVSKYLPISPEKVKVSFLSYDWGLNEFHD